MIYALHLFNIVSINIILALSLNIVAGYAGLLSLSQAAFYGIGAYVTALLSVQLGVNVWLSFAASALITGALASVVGATSSRFRSDYFVIVTFAFQILTFSLLNNLVSVTGGPNGITGINPPIFFGRLIYGPQDFAVVTGLFAVGSFLICAFIENSQFGRILRALREDETFARSLGFKVGLFKILAFAICGAMAALAGGLYATYVSYIDPTSFTFAESLAILAMVIIGGLGNSFGVVVGACTLTLIPEGLRFIGVEGAIASNIRQVLFGGCLLLIVFLRPSGLFSEKIAKTWSWR